MRFSSLACRISLMAVTGLLPPVLSGPALASPGGLNAEGCHTNRKTGDYHCHRKGGASKAAKATGGGRIMLLDSGAKPFANCSAARVAGAAPVRVGEPGYGRHLDRDGDGIGCE